MTCLTCEKCHSHDFEQLTPFYDKDGLKQVFKCKNCGVEIHLDPRYSAIIMPMVAADTPFSFWCDNVYLRETIKRLWQEIEELKKR
jgi:transcription elongation factor Elf1